jgi:hypothetical protein
MEVQKGSIFSACRRGSGENDPTLTVSLTSKNPLWLLHCGLPRFDRLRITHSRHTETGDYMLCDVTFKLCKRKA